MRNFRHKRLTLWLIFIVGLFAGCTQKSTPPGANSVAGAVDGVNYAYHYWDEGLRVFIWNDFLYGGQGCSATGSTEDPVHRLECNVQTQDGRQFEWAVHTRDGVTAEMWIDDRRFDLNDGAMFLVSSENGDVKIEQLGRDLSAWEPDNEAITAMARSDRDVAAFIEAAQPAGDSP